MAKQQTVNEDLRKERETCTFDLDELTNFLDGGAENTRRRRRLGNTLTIKFDYNTECIMNLDTKYTCFTFNKY